MPEHKSYDAVIVGTGQGGKPLAHDLAGAGYHTAIVERKHQVGGTCVLTGCTPTKTMIASARVAHMAWRAGDYGVRTGPVSVDMEAVRARKRDVVHQWSQGAREALENQDGLDLIHGTARFISPRTLEVEGDDGTVTHRLEAERIFLNVGGRPTVPTVDGINDVDYLTSVSVLELGHVPDHLVVLGGGFVGLEFGQMFRRFGSDVTILEAGPRIASREDPEISDALAGILRDDGITIRTGARAVRVARAGSGVEVVLDTDSGEESVVGSDLMVAVGRTSNTDLLNLEAAGLDTDGSGNIPADERRRTAVDGIWALGDVTGAPPFTHTSYDDYRVVKDDVLGDGELTTRGRVLTYAVFTDPQLGRVGLTEAQARKLGYDVKVAKLPMSRVARAVETAETRGLIKAVVDADTREILGAAVLGVQGGEIASAIKIAMMGRLPYTALRDAVLAHPTLAESLNNLFVGLD